MMLAKVREVGSSNIDREICDGGIENIHQVSNSVLLVEKKNIVRTEVGSRQDHKNNVAVSGGRSIG